MLMWMGSQWAADLQGVGVDLNGTGAVHLIDTFVPIPVHGAVDNDDSSLAVAILILMEAAGPSWWFLGDGQMHGWAKATGIYDRGGGGGEGRAATSTE